MKYFKIFILLFFLICISGGCVNNDIEDKRVGDEPELSSNAGLSNLTLSSGVLTPNFLSNVKSYSVSIQDLTSVSIIPEASDENAVVAVNGITVNSVNLSVAVQLINGSNTIEIFVTAEDKTTINIYNVIINCNTNNLVLNPSFETVLGEDIENWEVVSSGSLLPSSSLSLEDSINAYNGENAVYFESLTRSISGREVLSSSFNIDSDEKISISAFFRTDLIPEETGVSLKIYYYLDENCQIPASDPFDTMSTASLSAQNTWEEFTYERESDDIPDDALYSRISIRTMYSGEEIEGSFGIFFDEVSVTQP